ncbi:MAG: RnfH family protein [Arenicella sp.]
MSQHIIEVQIVYALPDTSWIKAMTVARGSTPEDLIRDSGFLLEFPSLKQQFNNNELAYGVYSQRVDQHYLLEQGDRLEIYRPLQADPKDVRRELAKQGKTMGSQSS